MKHAILCPFILIVDTSISCYFLTCIELHTVISEYDAFDFRMHVYVHVIVGASTCIAYNI